MVSAPRLDKVKVTCECGFRSYDDGAAHRSFAPLYCYQNSKFKGQVMSKEPVNTGNEQKSVKPKVRALLNKYKWFWWGNAAGPYGVTGISDTSAFKAGVFMAIESKYEGGGHTLSARQIGFLNSISAEQGFAFVVNQNNIGSLEVFLRNFGLAAMMVQKGKTVGPDKGGPMLDAIKALTDYPVSVEAYAQEKERNRAEVAKDLTAGGDSSDTDPNRPPLGYDGSASEDDPNPPV